MGIQIRLEGLDEVIGKLNRMANSAKNVAEQRHSTCRDMICRF